ncbi:MAG: glycosyltransferase [Deltaproteobacteria bacterium]|nr:glycosyltransferase [Deltaproteobacteria bacterium]
MARIGVVTPCYNGERFLESTVLSALAQGVDFEFVLVDDGSGDGSLALMRRLAAADPRIRVEMQANAGAASARNRGLAALSREVDRVMFLDADDVLEPGALAALSERLDANPRCGFVYGRSRRIDEHGAALDEPYVDHRYVPRLGGLTSIPPDVPETPFGALFAFYQAIPSSALVRRSLAEEVGWDPGLLRGMEDKHFALECAFRTTLEFLPRTVVAYRRVRGSLSDTHGMFAGLDQVRARWARRTDLPRDGRAQVLEAIAFESWVSGVMAGQDAASALVRLRLPRALVQGARSLVRAGRALRWSAAARRARQATR